MVYFLWLKMSKLSLKLAPGVSMCYDTDMITQSKVESTNSASLARAELEIKTLKEENLVLKKEIAEIRSAYKQLISESSHESYDERRINFLKAQIIQLERQILILNEALSSRSGVLLEVENSLASIADLCRHYLKQDGKIGELSVTRDDLQSLVQAAESARIRLYKNIENTGAENVEKHLIFLDRFIKPAVHKPITLFDICSGNMDHINLKHVAKLESRLSQLYRQLMLVSQTLHLLIKADSETFHQEKALFESANREKTDWLAVAANQEKATKLLPNKETFHKCSDLPGCLFARLGVQVAKACNMLKDSTEELLSLSVLVPSAPWPLLKKPFLKELTTDSVMSRITGMSRSKQTVIRDVVDSLIKAMNYACHMANVETRALKEEVAFHQEIYHLQMDYINSLWQALGVGYDEFQTHSNKLICEPMKEILSSYDTLQLTASEDALRHFLKVFKEHHLEIIEAVNKLSVHFEKRQGVEAISAYGEDLFQSLGKLRAELQSKREMHLTDIDTARQQYQDYMDEIKKMFPEIKFDASCHSRADTTSARQGKSEDGCHNGMKNPGESQNEKTTDGKVAECSITPEHGTNVKCENNLPDVKCNCGVEHKVDDFCPDHLHISRTEQNIKIRQQTKSGLDVAKTNNLRPLRSAKGIAQSKLVLKTDRTLSGIEHDLTSIGHQEIHSDADCWLDMGHTVADVSPSYAERKLTTPVNSGSSSKITHRTTKPGHLEPLIGLLTSAQLNRASPLSKPWK